MGVHGLWKLLEPAGKPIPVESLESKVLAVDVSIWLYQLTKGFQTAGGGIVPNAHLLGLFNRICKLLYYRIKPVFVFDGGVPLLKKETIETRKRQKRKAKDTSEALREKILKNLLKQKAVNQLLGENEDKPSTSRDIEADLFHLPPLPKKEEDSESNEESDDDTVDTKFAKVDSYCQFKYGKDLHSIDVNSEDFKALPADVRHEILSELVEMRKLNSWARIDEMPEESENFSDFQMKRLMKRREIQASLEEVTKELGCREMTLGELEHLLATEGVVSAEIPSARIANDDVTRIIYLSRDDMKKSTVKPTNEQVASCSKQTTMESEPTETDEKMFCEKVQTIEETMFTDDSSDEEIIKNDLQMKYAMQLSTEEGMSQQEILNLIRQNAVCPENDDADGSSGEYDASTDVRYKNETVGESDMTHETLQQSDLVKKLDHKALVDYLETPEDSHFDLNSQKSEISDKSEYFAPRTLSFDSTSLQSPMRATTSVTPGDYDSLNSPKSCEVSGMSDDSIDFSDVRVLTVKNVVSKDKEMKRNSEASCSDSETDSDDFIEVSQQSSDDVDNNVQEVRNFEITIDLNNVEKCDLFADIFESKREAGATETIIESTQTEIEENLEEKLKPLEFDETIVTDKIDDATAAVDSSKNESDQELKNGDKLLSKESGLVTFEAKLDCSLNDPKMDQEEITNFSNANENTTNKIVNVPAVIEDGRNENSHETINIENIEKDKIVDEFTKVNEFSNSREKTEELQYLQKLLNEEQTELEYEHGKQERFGANITQQMILEVQELLRLFGIPYIIAPMEAEAQCAYLDKIALTEGTITDDSDIWLFGGQKVYKNFFDNRKHVLQFRAIDIEHFFKLSREQMIQIAMLVGSDYTVGIEGIGPVTALEILSYFSDKNQRMESDEDVTGTLKKFRTWLNGNRSLSPLSKKVKNVNLTEDFPNASVVQAYLHPTVDESNECFTWATPDMIRIRTYVSKKFGWNVNKINEILTPVMKRLNYKKSQTTLDSYFKSKMIYNPVDVSTISKRVQQAVSRLKSDEDEVRNEIKSSVSKSTGVVLKQKRTPAKNSKPIKSTIPQREKDRLIANKRKQEAIKIFQAKGKKVESTKKKVLTPKKDSSYLSEESSDDGS